MDTCDENVTRGGVKL